MPRVLLCLLPMFLLAESLALSESKSVPEDERLAAHFQAFLDENIRKKPLDGTRLGDHRYDHLLDDLSAAARKEHTDWLRTTLKELPKKIDARRLSRAGQIDLEIWQHYLKRELWLAEKHRPFERDPRVYNDYLTESVYALLTQSTLPQAKNVQNCLARMKQMPAVVRAARENLKDPPRVVLETAIKQNRGAIAFYETGIFELAGETPQLSALRTEAKKVVAALREHQKFLTEELLPRAKGDWRLGKKLFAEKLLLELDAGITADEVLRDAEEEVRRVTHEMYVIARQMWAGLFPGTTMPPDDEKGRRETITRVLAKVNQDHGKPEHLVRDARAIAERVKDFIRKKDLLRLPEPDRCAIIEMPEFQRGNSIAFLNPAPPLDPKAKSIYAVSPPPREWSKERAKSFMEEYNRHMLQLLTIHEAYPGHYVQLEYANRCPSLIRKVLWSGVFAEGWAVYTEQVLLDEGYGEGDLALRLSQLKWYLRAVVNAILDYRMHCAGMTDEEALHLLVVIAFQSEGEAILKIIRAKQSSCQLSTYFVGRMAFQRLRRRVQSEMGERFDLGRFHEAALDHGTLPVKYLPEVVPERLKRPR